MSTRHVELAQLALEKAKLLKSAGFHKLPDEIEALAKAILEVQEEANTAHLETERLRNDLAGTTP